MSSRIPFFWRRGPSTSREKGRKMQGKKQRERYRRLDRAERAAIQSGLDKGRSCRQMARDLGRSPSTVADEVARNRTVSKARQGREGPGRAGGRVPQAAVVAALLQRVQEPALPQLLEEVALRVLGGPGAGARGRRAARVQDRRRPGRGRVRVRDGADQVRRGPGAVAPADSAGQGRPDRGLALDHIPVDIPRLRRDVRPRPAAQVRLQAALARRAAQGDGARRGALVLRVHGAAREEERAAACEMDTVMRNQVRPPVPAHIVPEGVQVPARAADARQDGRVDGIGAGHAREGPRRGPSPACSPCS